MEINYEDVVKLLIDNPLSSYKIGQDTGISDQTIQNYRDKKTKPKGPNLKILAKYLGIIKDDVVKRPTSELKPKIYESHIEVKLVTTKARAGFAGAYYADEYLKDMPSVLIEADKDYHGNYLAFEVDGDSMEPVYLPGDIVICREVKRDLWQYKLHFSEWDFVIAHGTKGIMIKEIVDHNTETGEIVCHSLNQEHGRNKDFTLNLREVAFLYNVVEHRRSGRNTRRNR